MPNTPNKKLATALPINPPMPKLLTQSKIHKPIEAQRTISLDESWKNGSSKSCSSTFLALDLVLLFLVLLRLLFDFLVELLFPFVAKLKPHNIHQKENSLQLFSFQLYLLTYQVIINIFVFFLLYGP